MSVYPNINIEVIKQIIERESVNIDSRIPDWISNKKKPTVKQLEKFSKKFRIPFGFLFLDTIPDNTISIPFFRKNNESIGINTSDMIQIIERRQVWMREYLEEQEYSTLDFVGKFNHTDSTASVVSDIKEVLELETGWTRKRKDYDDSFKFILEKLNNNRINIIKSSIVGNNTHRKIPINECRGFVLVDDYAPFIFINNDDYKSSQVFTLLHELAHIWLGKSAGFDNQELLPAEDTIEKKCNEIATELILPNKEFNDNWIIEKQDMENINNISKKFNVSKFVVLIKSYNLNKIKYHRYIEIYNDIKSKITNHKTDEEGDFYRNIPYSIGNVFLDYITQAIDTRLLSYKNAYELTGLRPKTFHEYQKRSTRM